MGTIRTAWAKRTAQQGQSVFDLCLQTYGTLDLLSDGTSAMLRLIADNNIDNINTVNLSGKQITFDPSLIANNQVITNNNSDNTIYATNIPETPGALQTNDGIDMETNDGVILLVN